LHDISKNIVQPEAIKYIPIQIHKKGTTACAIKKN